MLGHRIDIWTHILSPSYVRHLEAGAAQGPGAFLLAQRALHDVEVRLRTMEVYDDYRQVLTPIPHPHVDPRLAGPELARARPPQQRRFGRDRPGPP
jgi:hypothetical protein